MPVMNDASPSGKTPRKKAANLSLDSDLLEQARALGINLSATLDEALRLKIAQARASRWKDDNKAAIVAYNDAVEEHGLFSDDVREF